MTVPVNPHGFCTLEQGGNEGQGLFANGEKIISTVRRNQILRCDLPAVVLRGCCRGTDGAVPRRFCFTHLMDTTDDRTQADPVVIRSDVEGPAGPVGKNCEKYPSNFTEC